MPVVDSTKDVDERTFSITAEFSAPPTRVWQIWADPRKLERWWGPPSWPATFEQHDVTVGGESRYYMTGPNGEKARGWWRFTALDEPRSLDYENGFSDEAGPRGADIPTMLMHVDIEEAGDVTRMTVTTHFNNTAEMEQLVTMGMAEG